MSTIAAPQMCQVGYRPGLSYSPSLTSTSQSPALLSPRELSGQQTGSNAPFSNTLTNAQGSAARNALGEAPQAASGSPGALDYGADGLSTLDHSARSIDHLRRVAGTVRGAGGATRAGLAGSAAIEQASGLSKGLRVADGVMGPLGIASGAYGVYNGVNQMRDGKIVEGGLDTVGGAAGVVSGGAATTSAIMGAAAPAVVGALAAGGAGVAAAADGIKDIYQGVRDGDTEQAVTGGVKTVAGGLLIGGAATANPIAVGAGAVLYAGAVVYENREAIGQAVGTAANAVGNAVGSAASAVGNAVGSAAGAVGNAASSVWNWAFG